TMILVPRGILFFLRNERFAPLRVHLIPRQHTDRSLLPFPAAELSSRIADRVFPTPGSTRDSPAPLSPRCASAPVKSARNPSPQTPTHTHIPCPKSAPETQIRFRCPASIHASADRKCRLALPFPSAPPDTIRSRIARNWPPDL